MIFKEVVKVFVEGTSVYITSSYIQIDSRGCKIQLAWDKPNFNFTSLLPELKNDTVSVFRLFRIVLFLEVLWEKVEHLIRDAPLMGAKITYPFSSRVSSSLVTLAVPPSLL